MKSRSIQTSVAAIALMTLAACSGSDSPGPDSTPTPQSTRTQAPDLSEHESGPESPISYGLFVPEGATQLGPLFRYRSDRLIQAYAPELQAAVDQKAAETADRIAEDEANGTPSPTPTPTPTTRPSPDSFSDIDDPPRPDVSISLMRIDGDPTDVVLRMLAQIDTALPDADLSLTDLSKYCTSTERRITGCTATATGETAGSRDIRITMSVNPGKVGSRTSGPADLTRPVMQVTVEFVGDPRAGQLERETGSLKDIPDVNPNADVSGLIWPKMDEDAPTTTPLVDGWVAPTSVTLLLSGFGPQFAAMTTSRAVLADQVAAEYVTSRSQSGQVTKDVAEDFNSVTTTYASVTKNGSIARSVSILSARGVYTALFYTPA